MTVTDTSVTLTDDDAAPTGITLSVDTNGDTAGTPSTVGEGAGATSVTVTATVNGVTRYKDAKTVIVSVADDTADSPADYAAVSDVTLTIAAGAASRSGTFTVTPVDDSLDEPDETIDVTGSSGSLTVTGTEVTITDNDDAPSFSVTGGEANEGDSITFTVTRAGAAGNAVSVDIATQADSGDGVKAADTDDYTALSSRTLSFAATETSKTVMVATAEDDLFEPDETFKAVLSSPAKAQDDPATGVTIESGKGSATGTIKNDDTQPSFSVADASASEGDTITFTVTRSGAMDNVVSVKWNTKADTGANAASTGDYTPVTTATTLSFAKGVETQTFTVATTEDVLDEANETFVVELTDAVGGTISDAEATGTITDDDATPTGITLTVSPATIGEADSETRFTVTATVNGNTRYTDAKTVEVSVGGGTSTATSNTDYGAVNNFNITIGAGEANETGTFDLTPTQDTLHEGAETIDVTGTSGTLTITKATISLTDDDIAPTFAIADSSASEGNTITFTVTRSGATGAVASVKWNTADDSGDGVKAAIADTDYTAQTTAQTLSFAIGDASKTFTVATTEDSLAEGDETFLIELSDATGASISDDEATGTITDDDTAPSALEISVDADTGTQNVQTSLAENGGAKMVRITATLTGSSTFTEDKTVTVDVGKSTDSATEGADYGTVTQQSITITAGTSSGHKDFTLTPTDDALSEGSETISLDGTAAGLTVTDAAITLTDDDAAPTGITLTVSPATIGEADSETRFTVTATVNGNTRYTDAKTVEVSVGGGTSTATSNTDYGAVNNFNITIGAGEANETGTFDLTPTQDTLHEGAETIDVTGTSGTLTVTKATVTINDDEGTPTATLMLGSNSISENGGSTTITATLSGKSAQAVTLTVSAAPGADTTTGDYTLSSNKTLRIAAGSTASTGTVTITAVNNNVNAPDKTVTVSATASGGGVAAPASKTLTIEDDDATPPTALTITVDTDSNTGGDQNSVAEGAGETTVTVTATLDGNSRFGVDKTVTVKVGKNNDTAIEGTDYETVNDLTFTLKAGEASGSKEFTLTPINDGIDEQDETISVEGTLEGLTVTHDSITITDDDEAPSGLTITVDTDSVTDENQNSVDEDAGATTVTVTATLDGASRFADPQIVTVTVGAGSDNTAATEGTDYETVADFEITINPGAASGSKEFTLTPINDDLAEEDETISVTGTLAGVTVTHASITITDDDMAPSGLTITVDTPMDTNLENLGSRTAQRDSNSVDEGAGTTRITVTATLDGTTTFATDKTVAVDVGKDGDSAIEGIDYTYTTEAEPFTITINAGTSSGTSTFDLTPTDDNLSEDSETISIDGTSDGLTVTHASITITDNDAAPTGIILTVAPSSVDEDAGETEITVTATVNGTTRYLDAKTVTVSVGGGTATSGTDYTTVNNFNITIGAGAASNTGTFDLTPTDDSIHEGDETINVTGTTSDSITVTPATVTIEDDEPLPVISINSPSVKESGKPDIAKQMTFTITISPQSTQSVSVSYADTATGTATPGKDYMSPGSGILTFPPGTTLRTVGVTVNGDSIDEYDETVILRLSNPTNATLSGNAATLQSAGTIIDNNEPPTVSIMDADPVEEGYPAVFPVSLSGESGKIITVHWKTSSGTALEDVDYHGGSEQITIRPGTIEETIEIATIDDREIEDWTETF
ncbi:MAG: hypothetical protein OXH71_00540, partial [Candidatus Dadabacteria bacterium]|nr:hypothetical protein [Candidatus Dadabacteria bacterium]